MVAFSEPVPTFPENALQRDDFEPSSRSSLWVEHDLFRKPVSTHSASEDARERACSASEDARERAYDAGRKTRVNALMIKSGAGFFGICSIG